jgi:hypothetical protein
MNLKKIYNKCGSERMRMRKFWGKIVSGFPYVNQLWIISYLLYKMGQCLFAFVKLFYTYVICFYLYICFCCPLKGVSVLSIRIIVSLTTALLLLTLYTFKKGVTLSRKAACRAVKKLIGSHQGAVILVVGLGFGERSGR